MARARWRGLAKVLMQVLLTATVLNIKKLLVAITRLAKGAVAAVKSANVCCAALIIDVFVSAEYILSIRRACRDKDYRSVWALRC
ncbi:MAG: transposase [Sedimentisphaerales bacterium]|nr:transposase [Sedimentisphaerales bacterium]